MLVCVFECLVVCVCVIDFEGFGIRFGIRFRARFIIRDSVPSPFFTIRRALLIAHPFHSKFQGVPNIGIMDFFSGGYLGRGSACSITNPFACAFTPFNCLLVHSRHSIDPLSYDLDSIFRFPGDVEIWLTL